jgi:hypothetical protein
MHWSRSLLSQLWSSWADAVSVVQPATVIRWTGFKLFWTWKSRGTGQAARPSPRRSERSSDGATVRLKIPVSGVQFSPVHHFFPPPDAGNPRWAWRSVTSGPREPCDGLGPLGMVFGSGFSLPIRLNGVGIGADRWRRAIASSDP